MGGRGPEYPNRTVSFLQPALCKLQCMSTQEEMNRYWANGFFLLTAFFGSTLAKAAEVDDVKIKVDIYFPPTELETF